MSLLGETANPLVVSHDLPDELIHNTTRCWQIGPHHALVRVQDKNLQFRRASSKVRAGDREFIAISYQHQGTSVFLQGDAAITQLAGGLFLENVTESTGFSFKGTADNQSFLMSPEDLGLPLTKIMASAERLPTSPLYRMVQVHLARLSDVAEALSPDSEASALLASTTITLVRTLIASTTPEDKHAKDVISDSRYTVVLAYLRQHLRDPDLLAQKIAAANHISLRQLYNLWAGNGESLSSWILRERLDGAREDLTTPESLLVNIEVVAKRWGFVDAGHFSRRFREAYGFTPREWRMSQPATNRQH